MGILEEFNFEEFSKEDGARLKQGEELTVKGGILTPLIEQILESVLDAELTQHLDDAKKSAPNRKNGNNRRQVKCSNGGFELSTHCVVIVCLVSCIFCIAALNLN